MNSMFVICMLVFLTVLILGSKKIYKDLIKETTASSKVDLFIVSGISAYASS